MMTMLIIMMIVWSGFVSNILLLLLFIFTFAINCYVVVMLKCNDFALLLSSYTMEQGFCFNLFEKNEERKYG